MGCQEIQEPARDLESAIDRYAEKAEKTATANAANMGGHQNPEAAKATSRCSEG